MRRRCARLGLLVPVFFHFSVCVCVNVSPPSSPYPAYLGLLALAQAVDIGQLVLRADFLVKLLHNLADALTVEGNVVLQEAADRASACCSCTERPPSAGWAGAATHLEKLQLTLKVHDGLVRVEVLFKDDAVVLAVCGRERGVRRQAGRSRAGQGRGERGEGGAYRWRASRSRPAAAQQGPTAPSPRRSRSRCPSRPSTTCTACSGESVVSAGVSTGDNGTLCVGNAPHGARAPARETPSGPYSRATRRVRQGSRGRQSTTTASCRGSGPPGGWVHGGWVHGVSKGAREAAAERQARAQGRVTRLHKTTHIVNLRLDLVEKLLLKALLALAAVEARLEALDDLLEAYRAVWSGREGGEAA